MYVPNGEQSLSLYRDMAIFFLFFKENPLMNFVSSFCPSLFGDISSIIKSSLAPMFQHLLIS
jgi:hypothetical protein